MLLITKEKNFFFSDFRYMTQAQKQVKGFEIIQVARDSTTSIAESLKKLNLNKLIFEAGNLTVSQFRRFEKGLSNISLVPLDADPAYVRMVKNADDITKIKAAIHVNNVAFEDIFSQIKLGMSEKDIAFILELALRKHGADKLSFDTIVASGPRGALPHGAPTEKKIAKGELVTIDFGVVVDGFCSDETCTIGIGALSAEQKKIYTIVKDAHDMAIDKIKPGMKGKEIDKIARDHIEKKGYGKYFGHSLGHGIGMAVHERPMVSHVSNDVIEDKMVFSIEPGIYIPNWGGVRIEDLVECTPTGGHLLSEINKDLRVVDV